MFYQLFMSPNCRNRAPIDMGITLKATRNSAEHRAIVLNRLQQLMPIEVEACILHFIEGRSEELVAQWLGLSLRTVQRHINHAVLKVPELRPLRKDSLTPTRRPKIYAFSQLGRGERGPFNPDEI